MPLFEETNQKNEPKSSSANQKPHSLITVIGQLLPLAPFVYEQFTGQKVPPMTGTLAEMQMTLLNIQTNLQTIANNQQSLNQRLISLESSANNLTHQFKNLRLTHTKEQKQIEYNNNSPLEAEN
jgi:septal ring factor EnvC (AmiA/AmiB activator)